MRCHPDVKFPDGWDIWHSDNHWSNEDTIKRYLEIILPFVNCKKEKNYVYKTACLLKLGKDSNVQTY